MEFPTYRPRRLRKNEKLRGMIRETSLSVKDFIYPLFVGPGTGNSYRSTVPWRSARRRRRWALRR